MANGAESVRWARHGASMCLLANVNRGKSGRPYKPSDFIPKEYAVETQSQANDFEAIRDHFKKEMKKKQGR